MHNPTFTEHPACTIARSRPARWTPAQCRGLNNQNSGQPTGLINSIKKRKTMKTIATKTSIKNDGNGTNGKIINPTVANVLSEVRDHLTAIADEYLTQEESMPENLQASCLFDELGEKAEAIQQTSDELEDLVASLCEVDADDNNNRESTAIKPVSLGNFQVTPPRFIQGSRPKRIGRLIQIMNVVADAVEPKNAEVAENLWGIVSELENL